MRASELTSMTLSLIHGSRSVQRGTAREPSTLKQSSAQLHELKPLDLEGAVELARVRTSLVDVVEQGTRAADLCKDGQPRIPSESNSSVGAP